jgi:hypothetical protein
MGNFLNYSNNNRTTIEEQERYIEILQEQRKEEIKKILTIEEKSVIEAKKEEGRKKVILFYFKDLTGKDMTEEEYKNYTSILDDKFTRKGYNIKNFIEGDDGRVKMGRAEVLKKIAEELPSDLDQINKEEESK